ncbi:hypothetical protein BFG04_00785 [Campylobacter pinnipediorum subsp. pinnipediorum]|uniref:RDD domain-containing protein n=1 Tax=Campylobacter pinnipediorum subsp. pinnipediorum TaxID=1660067 RepID=A0AAX0LBR7_9BACT|nr:RDD family protein [Campylobacter pinnipediorum]OPA81710.1 hypothetical protein BFG04_00785 [Campylobacter pinnipediorum subsp. pinnipediorum]
MSDSLELRLEKENIKIASIAKRSVAFGIDEILVSVLFMVVFYDYFKLYDDPQDMVNAISKIALQYVLIRFVYQTFFVWYYGATIGKISVKIACVDIEYFDKPKFIPSVIRALVRNISESAFYLGFIWAFGNPVKQTWQDKLSKTVVIDVS